MRVQKRPGQIVIYDEKDDGGEAAAEEEGIRRKSQVMC